MLVQAFTRGHWAGEPSGPEGGKAGDTIAVVIVSGLPVFFCGGEGPQWGFSATTNGKGKFFSPCTQELP